MAEVGMANCYFQKKAAENQMKIWRQRVQMLGIVGKRHMF